MIIKEIPGLGPEGAYLALKGLGNAFIIRNPQGPGYSFAGAGPKRIVRTESGATTIDGRPGAYNDPFEAISAVLEEEERPGIEGPFPFIGGVAAYFSYDLKDLIEPGIPFIKKNGPGIPDCIAGFYDPVFAYDHGKEKGFLVSASGRSGRFEEFRRMLLAGASAGPGKYVEKAKEMRSDVSQEEYLSAVMLAKEYIAAGDIYQINLSQRLSFEWAGDPLALFFSLSERHPAPYGAFMDFGSFQIVSNSPECLLRVKDGFAETRPIKGTRRRGRTEAEDIALIKELKASAKEASEHVMIVDLERNDLGRISVAGSVEVSSFAEIESYPHLHHMVSTIRGKLKRGIGAAAALKAVFPGGSITGAPKIRAMEIIDGLERSRRSVYTGGIGWFDRNGGAEISLAIRTALCMNGKLHLSVGGGIVADSAPVDEYEETILKAGDFLDALGLKEGT